MKLCPCHSNLTYKECCEPFHKGSLSPNALLLMRSRYSAYALKLVDYIIGTTHHKNPQFNPKFSEWREKILQSYGEVQFEGLKILEFLDGEKEAYVTFYAILKQGNIDKSFMEKNSFLKEDGKWFYLGAALLQR